MGTVRTALLAGTVAAALALGVPGLASAQEAAPTLTLSPTSGPPSTPVVLAGEAPGGVDCPSIRIAVARPAGGVAAAETTVGVTDGRYETTVEMSAIELPTEPPSIASEAVVRAFCVEGGDGSGAMAEATFTYTEDAPEEPGAPRLTLSPSSGPPGTVAVVSGDAPGGVECPAVRIAVGRPAGGVALDEVQADVDGSGRFEATVEMPPIEVPTEPPSLAPEAAVRSFCATAEDGDEVASGEAIFTYTDVAPDADAERDADDADEGAGTGSGGPQLPATGSDGTVALALVGGGLVAAGAVLLVVRRRSATPTRLR
jgi:LPXTG-motif cell wall-anchored protein